MFRGSLVDRRGDETSSEVLLQGLFKPCQYECYCIVTYLSRLLQPAITSSCYSICLWSCDMLHMVFHEACWFPSIYLHFNLHLVMFILWFMVLIYSGTGLKICKYLLLRHSIVLTNIDKYLHIFSHPRPYPSIVVLKCNALCTSASWYFSLCARLCGSPLQLVGVDSLYIHKIGHFHMVILTWP